VDRRPITFDYMPPDKISKGLIHLFSEIPQLSKASSGKYSTFRKSFDLLCDAMFWAYGIDRGYAEFDFDKLSGG